MNEQSGKVPTHKHLMLSRRFAPLFWCQFLSAFRDNALRNVLVLLVLFEVGGAQREILITLAIATFIGPFFLLSGLGGQLADRFDKAQVTRSLKLAEIACAGVAVIGFALHSVAILFLSLLAFGVVAALFGPVKYGILPDHLARSELPAGNALIEGGTFLAILLGTIVGGILAKDGGDPVQFAGFMLLSSLVAWAASLLILRTGPGAPGLAISLNIIGSTVEMLGYLRRDHRLLWGALTVSWFWLNGALVLSLLPPLVKDALGAREEVVTLYLAVFSVAIAAGAGLAALIARGRLILWPTALGGVIIGAFALDLGLASQNVAAASDIGLVELVAAPQGWRIIVDLAGLAIGGGFYVVPALAAVQAWASANERARVMAGVNVLSAGFMVIGSLLLAMLQAAGLSTSFLFVALGASNFAAAIVLATTMPSAPDSKNPSSRQEVP
jgi:acyl-[acyl-carrier-protein]-phospholipid O-acyltransferase / long-chain-fatty-acid--[acyl-carrier-protein] ligase